MAAAHDQACRMLTARATASATVTNEASDCRLISHLAVAVSGIVSVGLNAVALVSEVYRESVIRGCQLAGAKGAPSVIWGNRKSAQDRPPRARSTGPPRS